MNKRLRKKKHIGEFALYGTRYEFGYTAQDHFAFHDSVIDEVERLGLFCGGLFGLGKVSMMLELGTDKSKYDRLESDFELWLTKNDCTVTLKGPREDLWNGAFND